jgi:energy-converting hydrogenase Eha subunit H
MLCNIKSHVLFDGKYQERKTRNKNIFILLVVVLVYVVILIQSTSLGLQYKIKDILNNGKAVSTEMFKLRRQIQVKY